MSKLFFTRSLYENFKVTKIIAAMKTICLILFLSFTFLKGFTQEIKELEIALEQKNYFHAQQVALKLQQDSTQEHTSKFWFLCGKMYSTMADDIRGNIAKLDSLALYKAHETLDKARRINNPVEYGDSAKMYLEQLHIIALNTAGRYFKEGYATIKNTLKINPENTYINDTTIIQLHKALQSAELAHTLHPQDTLGYSLALYACKYLQDYDTYVRLSEEVIRLTNDKNIKIELYEALLDVCNNKLQDKDKTLLVLQRALKDFPNNQKWKDERTTLGFEINRSEIVLNDALEKVQKSPEDAQARYDLAERYRKYGQENEALQSYLKCIELDPSNLNAVYRVGGVYYNEAVSKMQVLSQLSFHEHHKKGKILENEIIEQLQKCLPYFERTYQFSTQNRELLIALKTCYKFLKNTEKEQQMISKLKK